MAIDERRTDSGIEIKRRPVKDGKRRLRVLYRQLAGVVEQRNALSDLDTYMNGRPAAVGLWW